MPIQTLINKEVSHKLQIRKAWWLHWLGSLSSRPDSSLAIFGFSSTCLPVLNCFPYRLQIFVHGDVRSLRTFSLCYSLPTDRSKTLLLCWCSDGFLSAACELCKYETSLNLLHKKWSKLAKTLIKRSKSKLKTEKQTCRTSRRVKNIETWW